MRSQVHGSGLSKFDIAAKDAKVAKLSFTLNIFNYFRHGTIQLFLLVIYFLSVLYIDIEMSLDPDQVEIHTSTQLIVKMLKKPKLLKSSFPEKKHPAHR